MISDSVWRALNEVYPTYRQQYEYDISNGAYMSKGANYAFLFQENLSIVNDHDNGFYSTSETWNLIDYLSNKGGNDSRFDQKLTVLLGGMLSFARGLQEKHSKGIVHNDLKRDNIAVFLTNKYEDYYIFIFNDLIINNDYAILTSFRFQISRSRISR